MKHPNRESWLLAATESLRSGLFLDQGATVPNVRVSVGFPGGRGSKKAIGQIWHAQACTDSIPQVFVSPIISDPVTALEILVHELVHAVHPQAGHKGLFGTLARALGLEGKLTATVAGPELKNRLNALSSKLGEYPHSSINLDERKKQGTRMLKGECLDCGYTVRLTKKWVELLGAPLCPCNSKPMQMPEGEED